MNMKKLIESIDKLSTEKVEPILNESTGVTDFNPPSQGGTRKELLAKLRKTKDPKDATKARKAGATQKELQDAMKGVEEAYQFKGSFPFDVDHMHGGRGINLPKAETKKYFTDKKQWEQAVDDINSSKYDDNSEYTGMTGRSTVSIDGREWARWSDAQQKGYIELSSMSEQGVAEDSISDKIKGAAKSVKRATQGWGVGAAPDMITPAGAVSAFKNMDGQRLANFVASRKDQSKPRKNSAGSFVDKVIDREMKQRGYGRVADKDEQGVAEAGNKPLEKSRFGMGDTRTPRDIKSQMSGASDEFVKSTAGQKTGPFHSKVAKMQGKMAKSELRKREQGVEEAYQFKGPFPFDVDHMPGAVHRDGDRTTDNVKSNNKRDWDRAVNSINARVFDDNADYSTTSAGTTVDHNGVVFALWSNKDNAGWFNVKGRKLQPNKLGEQGVAEGSDRKDMTGQTCEKCGKDQYQERSQHDDMEGKVTCSCGNRVNRWKNYKEQDVAEGYFDKDEEDNQLQMDATRRGRLNREREPSGSEKIDARLRAQNDQLAQYNQSGKFWLKQKDTQEHLSDSFDGKQAATAAAVALLKQRPELKGNLVITAYGPGETQGVAEGNRPATDSSYDKLVKSISSRMKDTPQPQREPKDDEERASWARMKRDQEAIANIGKKSVAEGRANLVKPKQSKTSNKR